MSNAYTSAMREHVQIQLDNLNELSDIAAQQPLRKFDRLATERCLQMLVESAIGIAKHCCKKAGKSVSGEAYRNLLTAHDLLNSPIPHALLKGALGMRNAIVHDYLNLDWGRIESVLMDKQYQAIGEFIDSGLAYLSQ